MALTTAAAIIGAGALGAGASIAASSKASKTQAQAANDATAAQERMFQQQQALQEPFRQGGITAQNRIMELLGLGPRPQPVGQPSVNAFAPGAQSAYLPQAIQQYAQQYGTPMPAYGDGNMIGDIGMISGARESGVPVSEMFGGYTPAVQYAQNAGMNAPENVNMMAAPLGAAPESDFGKYARDFSMADYQADPGYAFRQSEGMKALERSAAARGGLLSGGALKGIQRFGQDLASQEYQNAFNRYQVNRANQLNPLQSLMGSGQSAANTLTGAAGQMGQNQAANITNAGAARASGYVGGANALNSALGGVSSYMINAPLYQAQTDYYKSLADGGGLSGVVNPSLSYSAPSLSNTFANAYPSVSFGK